MTKNGNSIAKGLFSAVLLGAGLMAATPSGANDPAEQAPEIQHWVCHYVGAAQGQWFIHCMDPERDDPAAGEPADRQAEHGAEMLIPLRGYPHADSRGELLVRAVLCPRDRPCSVMMGANPVAASAMTQSGGSARLPPRR